MAYLQDHEDLMLIIEDLEQKIEVNLNLLRENS